MISLSSNVNVLHPTYNIKLGFYIKKIDIDTKQILSKYFQYNYNRFLNSKQVGEGRDVFLYPQQYKTKVYREKTCFESL